MKKANRLNEPLLSVCLITYNHAQYIRQAVGGVLNQKANFSYELIIADDNSTDGTREIILEYKRQHPGFIKLILQEKNVGAAQNWLDLITAPKSKYIAYFEGDDYWIDSYKLQKQVDFLETNPDYGLVFSDADHLYENTGKVIKNYDKTFKRNIPTGDVLEDLIYGNPYKTCTAVFNREIVYKKFNLVTKYNFKVGDRFLWLLLAGKLKVGYIKDSTAVYRLRANSASHARGFKPALYFIKNGYKMSIFFSELYQYELNKKKLKHCFKQIIIITCIQSGYYKELLNYCGNPLLILKLFIKEKIFRKLLVDFE